MAQFRLTMQPEVLQIGNFTPVRLVLTNLSCADLHVQRIEPTAWIKLEPTPAQLLAGQSITLRGQANTLGLQKPQVSHLRVKTDAGTASLPVMVIEEFPTLTVAEAEIEVWGDRPLRMDVSVFPAQGALRLRSVRRGSMGNLEVVQGLAAPQIAEAGAAPTVTVLLEPERFRRTSAARLLVEYDGPHGPAETEVDLNVAYKTAPHLRWEEEYDPPVERLAMANQKFTFAFSNKSADGGSRNARLLLEEVEVQVPHESGQAVFRVTEPLLPVSIAGGKSATVHVLADLQAMQDLPDELVHLRMRLKVNGATVEKSVPVFIRPLPEFDGVLAIDFGSSNTCAAVVATGRAFEPLRLEASSDLSPTVLRYRSLDGPSPSVETGSEVKRLAAINERIAASTISGLKQRLGEKRQEIPVRPGDSTQWRTRTAEQATSDYLREVRRAAEANSQSVFRSFVLTHPAVCTLQQYRNLSRAMIGAFGDVAQDVTFLQEPIAALIPFLAEHASPKENTGYTVASFDLGGGTTDIAVVRVHQSAGDADRVEIRPTILYSRGVRFGGEDLSDFLQKELEARIEAVLASGRSGAMLIRKDVPGTAMDDVLRNRFALRESAELLKASLSEEHGAAVPKTITVRVLLPEGKADDFPVPFAQLAGATGSDLTASFRHHVRECVRAMAQLLVTAQKRHGNLDYVQLSGKTAWLPEVVQELRSSFPNARVERSNNPKGCVVTGACLSITMGRSARKRLVLPHGGRRTTSSIGLYDVSTATFEAILPVDTAIPPEGLVADVPATWFGTEKVALYEALTLSGEPSTDGPADGPSMLDVWTPEQKNPEATNTPWTLRLVLKDYEVNVSAIGPGGETVRFTPGGRSFAGRGSVA